MPGFQILCCVTWFYFARERLSNEMPSMQKTSQACKRDQFLVLLHPCCLSLLISENKGLEKFSLYGTSFCFSLCLRKDFSPLSVGRIHSFFRTSSPVASFKHCVCVCDRSGRGRGWTQWFIWWDLVIGECESDFNWTYWLVPSYRDINTYFLRISYL